ncbi:MAG: hypothetical protein RI900_1174 [Actinomycetota bacterium]|jgi:hypothetical protein
MSTSTAIKHNLEHVSVGRPVTRGHISLFPVYVHGHRVNIPTGSEAGVVIGEKASAEVPTLEAENPTEHPVLLVDGEIVTGGWQTRVLNVSVLVAPNGRIDIPVSCVEQGRWNGGRAFDRKAMFAPRRVRRAKNATVAQNLRNSGAKRTDQGMVWATVSAELSRLEVHADSGTLEAAAARLAGGDMLGRAAHELRRMGPLPEQCGVVITHGSRVVSAEVFSSPEMLAIHWPAIVDAAILDAPATEPTSRPSASKVLRFLRRITEAEATVTPGVGLGTEYHVRTPKFVAQALVHGDIVVHASAFALAA